MKELTKSAGLTLLRCFANTLAARKIRIREAIENSSGSYLAFDRLKPLVLVIVEGWAQDRSGLLRSGLYYRACS